MIGVAAAIAFLVGHVGASSVGAKLTLIVPSTSSENMYASEEDWCKHMCEVHAWCGTTELLQGSGPQNIKSKCQLFDREMMAEDEYHRECSRRGATFKKGIFVKAYEYRFAFNDDGTPKGNCNGVGAEITSWQECEAAAMLQMATRIEQGIIDNPVGAFKQGAAGEHVPSGVGFKVYHRHEGNTHVGDKQNQGEDHPIGCFLGNFARHGNTGGERLYFAHGDGNPAHQGETAWSLCAVPTVGVMDACVCAEPTELAMPPDAWQPVPRTSDYSGGNHGFYYNGITHVDDTRDWKPDAWHPLVPPREPYAAVEWEGTRTQSCHIPNTNPMMWSSNCRTAAHGVSTACHLFTTGSEECYGDSDAVVATKLTAWCRIQCMHDDKCHSTVYEVPTELDVDRPGTSLVLQGTCKMYGKAPMAFTLEKAEVYKSTYTKGERPYIQKSNLLRGGRVGFGDGLEAVAHPCVDCKCVDPDKAYQKQDERAACLEAGGDLRFDAVGNMYKDSAGNAHCVCLDTTHTCEGARCKNVGHKLFKNVTQCDTQDMARRKGWLELCTMGFNKQSTFELPCDTCKCTPRTPALTYSRAPDVCTRGGGELVDTRCECPTDFFCTEAPESQFCRNSFSRRNGFDPLCTTCQCKPRPDCHGAVFAYDPSNRPVCLCPGTCEDRCHGRPASVLGQNSESHGVIYEKNSVASPGMARFAGWGGSTSQYVQFTRKNVGSTGVGNWEGDWDVVDPSSGHYDHHTDQVCGGRCTNYCRWVGKHAPAHDFTVGTPPSLHNGSQAFCKGCRGGECINCKDEGYFVCAGWESHYAWTKGQPHSSRLEFVQEHKYPYKFSDNFKKCAASDDATTCNPGGAQYHFASNEVFFNVGEGMCNTNAGSVIKGVSYEECAYSCKVHDRCVGYATIPPHMRLHANTSQDCHHYENTKGHLEMMYGPAWTYTANEGKAFNCYLRQSAFEQSATLSPTTFQRTNIWDPNLCPGCSCRHTDMTPATRHCTGADCVLDTWTWAWSLPVFVGRCAGTERVLWENSVSPDASSWQSDCAHKCAEEGTRSGWRHEQGYSVSDTGGCTCEASGSSTCRRIKNQENGPVWTRYDLRVVAQDSKPCIGAGCVADTRWMQPMFIGGCEGNEFVAHDSLPGTKLEQQTRCAEACAPKEGAGLNAKGYLLEQGTGRCICQEQPSKDCVRVDKPGYKRYDIRMVNKTTLNCTEPPTPAPYRWGESGVNACPDGYSRITTLAGCEKALRGKGINLEKPANGMWPDVEHSQLYPAGCYAYISRYVSHAVHHELLESSFWDNTNPQHWYNYNSIHEDTATNDGEDGIGAKSVRSYLLCQRDSIDAAGGLACPRTDVGQETCDKEVQQVHTANIKEGDYTHVKGARATKLTDDLYVFAFTTSITKGGECIMVAVDRNGTVIDSRLHARLSEVTTQYLAGFSMTNTPSPSFVWDACPSFITCAVWANAYLRLGNDRYTVDNIVTRAIQTCARTNLVCGCDGRTDFDAKEDECGLCNGDNEQCTLYNDNPQRYTLVGKGRCSSTAAKWSSINNANANECMVLCESELAAGACTGFEQDVFGLCVIFGNNLTQQSPPGMQYTHKEENNNDDLIATIVQKNDMFRCYARQHPTYQAKSRGPLELQQNQATATSTTSSTATTSSTPTTTSTGSSTSATTSSSSTSATTTLTPMCPREHGQAKWMTHLTRSFPLKYKEQVDPNPLVAKLYNSSKVILQRDNAHYEGWDLRHGDGVQTGRVDVMGHDNTSKLSDEELTTDFHGAAFGLSVNYTWVVNITIPNGAVNFGVTATNNNWKVSRFYNPAAIALPALTGRHTITYSSQPAGVGVAAGTLSIKSDQEERSKEFNAGNGGTLHLAVSLRGAGTTVEILCATCCFEDECATCNGPATTTTTTKTALLQAAASTAQTNTGLAIGLAVGIPAAVVAFATTVFYQGWMTAPPWWPQGLLKQEPKSEQMSLL